MATKINLCSQALLNIGANTIQSFNDGSHEAEVAANLYELAKRSELSSYQWNFTIKTFMLSQNLATPVNKQWKYGFKVPPDMIKLLTVTDKEGDTIPYEITNLIYTNDKISLAKYQRDVPEESFKNYPYFEALLVSRLSYEFSKKLAEDSQILLEQENDYKQKQRLARGADAKSNQPTQLIGPHNSPWVHAHYGGRSGGRWR